MSERLTDEQLVEAFGENAERFGVTDYQYSSGYDSKASFTQSLNAYDAARAALLSRLVEYEKRIQELEGKLSRACAFDVPSFDSDPEKLLRVERHFAAGRAHWYIVRENGARLDRSGCNWEFYMPANMDEAAAFAERCGYSTAFEAMVTAMKAEKP